MHRFFFVFSVCSYFFQFRRLSWSISFFTDSFLLDDVALFFENSQKNRNKHVNSKKGGHLKKDIAES
jgi:hypothetical protein